MHQSARKRWLASVGAVAAVATLATGGAFTANAADTMSHPNADVAYPTFTGSSDPMKTAENTVSYNPTTSYLAETFAKDQANGAGTDTDHDFWIDSILARTGAQPNGKSSNSKGDYTYEGSDGNNYLFTRGRAAYMYTHTPGRLGFVGDTAYWDQTSQNGYTITVEADGKTQTLNEDTSQRKQTPSYFKTVFQTSGKTLKITEVKYITNNNVMVTNLTVESTADRDVTITAASPFATTGDDGAAELTGRFNVKNNLTTIYPRFSGNDFTVSSGKLTSTLSLKSGEAQTTKLQLGLIANELPDSTTEYEARYTGDLKDPAASYKDSVTTYNQWWVDNAPYVDTPEDNIDKTVVYRWWLSRFNMLDANMPGNTFQYPTSIEGVLGYNNQIVLTSGMFMMDTKWFRNPEYSYGTWLSAGDTAKKGKSGYYYYHDNPGDPANWNHSYTQYITRAGWDSYKVHGGPSTVAEKLADQGAEDVQGLLNSNTESDNNDNQNNNKNSLIDWSWWSMTGNDADAVSFSEPGRSGQRMDRADGSANMWANANAAAQAYKAAGDTANAEKMQKIADNIKQDVLDNLWDSSDNLIKHKWLSDGAFAKYKEINNYYPYSEGLMPTGNSDYNQALRLFADSDEFPIFPFFTANQADKAALNFPGSNNFSIINAQPLLQVYSSGIRNYDANKNGYITNEQFKKLLYWVAFAHYQGGNNEYPDQNEFWNEDNNNVGDLNGDGKVNNQDKNLDAAQNGGKITYRSWIHHTQLGTTNWTMIEDVAGMVPREDNKIELNPIEIPGWNYFTVNNLSYHGQDVSIVWDKDGSHYGGPAGYSLYVGGKLAFTSDKLAHLIYDPSAGTVEDADKAGVTITSATGSDLKAANQVAFTADQRVTDLFAKAGTNVDSASKSTTNVAEGGSTEATYNDAKGYEKENAVDGKTVMESFWGTKGSKNKTDSLTVTFKNGAQDIDDIRLYYYQTSSSQTISGYAEPANYKLEYQKEDGTWVPIEGQVRTPNYASANYNRIQFTPVKAKAIRATFTPQAGMAVGIKEIEAYNTGIKPTGASENQAPEVDAYVSSSTASGATLVGTVKDDGLPADGEISTKWELVSGPEGGTAKFVDDTAASTTVTFNKEGDYVLKLTASDGELSTDKQITVHGIPSDGTVNVAPQSSASASYTNGYQPKDNAKKVVDGQVVYTNTPNETWNNWGDNTGVEPWLQLQWSGKVPLKKAKLYFWTDGGGVPMVSSWKLQYADADGNWQDVKLADGQSYTTNQNQGNEVKFAETIETDKLRVVFPKGAIVGASEFETYAIEPQSVDEVSRMVQTGTKAADLNLPKTVSATYTDGSRRDLAVTWGNVTDAQLVDGANIDVKGTVAGALSGSVAHVSVRSDANAQTKGNAQPVEQTVYQNAKSIDLPATVPVKFPNGVNDDREVTWKTADAKAIDLTKVGDYTVSGTVKDGSSDAAATLIVHVVADPNGSSEPEPEPEPLTGWIEGKATNTSASAEASWSKAEGKLNDGVVVDDTWPDTDDQDVNAKVWGSWGAAVDGMYAQYDFGQDVTVDSSRAQFWANFAETDDAKGGLEIPEAWKIQYLAEDGSWKDVEPTGDGAYQTVRNSPAARATENDGWSTVTFKPVTTKSLRLVLTPHTGTGTFGAAVAEWGVRAVDKTEPEPEQVDKAALQSALEAANSLDGSKFAADAYAEFQQAIASAQAVYDAADATAEDVAKAVEALNAAQDKLKGYALADAQAKSDLQTLVDQAKQTEADSSKYTEDSFKAAKLDEAIEAGEAALAKGDQALATEVSGATTGLKTALKTLVKKVVKDNLQTSINRASKADKSKYTEKAWNALQDAIKAAQKVFDNADATQPEADAAQDALDKAYYNTKGEQKPGSQQPGVTDNKKKGGLTDTGAAVSAVAAAAVLFAAAGVTILKRCQSDAR
ncbi:bacterial Ig-like domain-containing protein [Bifidobacterium saguini DSM 23967]|uniref:Bacterial Ig-like domain-containing protein n=2 Tax=Bifidobacterium saguini TaxID=762210 RepID=A0A087DB60_9BIFI|nr:beta-L-arabinobiosidase HypBA2 [Bifidobacterium saguini]KFI92760.1 bacterial Ig-like domain-containing protein [Bifidobacterium saguini DSM 23967]QTB91766.1 Ig-like domain-containing protein [Bifidobacterium saguini]